MTGTAYSYYTGEIMNKAITVTGKHNKAIVYAKALEVSCENKLRQFLDQPVFADTRVRIMPDVHIGKGAVVGFTASRGAVIVPAIIGVDIGCGVTACNLGRGKIRFDKLDAFIKKQIPAGMEVRSSLHEKFADMISFIAEREEHTPGDMTGAIGKLCEKQNHSPERIFASLGTLGGGNHFIELDLDEDHNRWLLIHSGSRIFGARTAEYHEIRALRETPEENPIKYLAGNFAEEYCADMALVQHYAKLNRALMAETIVEGFFKEDFTTLEYIDSVHNYIDLSASIIRKGAISAQKDERVIIPFSMSEGAIIGRGKGNPEWNYSAPHGSGRKLSRSQSKQGLSLDEYRKEMRGVWSSVIGKGTLEESPMAYKRPRDVLEYIGETVETERRLKPVYNFKAEE
jgi:RNA-splicing ligase RtcB